MSEGRIKKVPMRTCVGCGANKPKKDLVRVIRTSEGEITLDLTGRANGRGAYLCRNVECLKRALKTKSIARSLKEPIPEEVADKLLEELSHE